MRAPHHCRKEAYALFDAAVARLEEPGALVEAAVAVARHALPDADPSAVARRLETLAERVRARVSSGRPQAYLAHLHAVLFDEEGFRGDVRTYNDPRNSYLPSVLERRRGLPITLTLVYKAVGERAGLRIDGINAPAHFLACVAADGGPLYVDCFHRGRALTRAEAQDFLRDLTGLPGDVPLPVASARQWIARLLRNLQGHFALHGRRRDAAAMTELFHLLRHARA